MPRGIASSDDKNSPPRYTIKQLNANSSLLDLTRFVEKDTPHPIGRGACGDVYRGTYTYYLRPDNTTGEQMRCSMKIVIKVLRGIISEKEKIEQRLNREIATWGSLNHPNVTQLLGIAHMPDLAPWPTLVSQWAQRSNFLEYIGKHPEQKRKKAQEIACGLEYLHNINIFDGKGNLQEQGIVHGDLKVDNILISDRGLAQITDFGIARILGVKGFTTTLFGRNVRHAAPELMPIVTEEDVEEAILPTTASDIYSLGILLLQLFHGPDKDMRRGQPYNHIPSQEGDYPLLVRICNGDRPRRARYNFIPDQYWTLMTRCWAGDPLERPNIAEVGRLL